MKRNDRNKAASHSRAKGSRGESLAGKYLENQGYRILEYNYHCRYAEIDIVAMDGDTLVFCEVKYRTTGDPALIVESVTSEKQRKISLGALFYMRQHRLHNLPCRFDVIGICGCSGSSVMLLKNAFEYIGD